MINSVTVCANGNRIIINSNNVVPVQNFKVPFNKVKKKNDGRAKVLREPRHLQEKYTELRCEKLLRAIGFN